METLGSLNKILVPVDYSEYSLLAGRYALKIAQKLNIDIHFFHAFYSPAYDLIELTGNRRTQKKLRDDVTQRLMVTEIVEMENFKAALSLTVEYKSYSKKPPTYILRPGLAKEEIIQYVTEFEPDIVIMGTRGQDKKKNSVLGSITEIAIKKIKRPVIAIPEDYQFEENEKFNKVLYLTDFDESDFVSIRKLMAFTDPLGMNIYCVQMGGAPDKMNEIKMSGLKNYFKSAYNKTLVECDILPPQEKILEALDDYVKANKINLISLTTRKRTIISKLFKPNLTRKLFYHTNIPILVFHS